MAEHPASNRDDRLREAVAHHRAGRTREAESIYEEVLAEWPAHAGALHLLGVIRGQAGRAAEAVALIRRAIAIEPGAAAFHCNLGKFLADLRRLPEAAAALRAAIALRPGYVAALVNLGAVLGAIGESGEALAVSREALAIRPDLAAAHNNAGNALRGLGAIDEAIASYRQAVRIEPGHAEALTNLGHLLKDTGRIGEAVDAYRAALRAAPGRAEAQHALLAAIHYDPAFDAVAIGEEARRWAAAHAEALAPSAAAAAFRRRDRSPGRRLRIGYVSADFREHPVGYNLLPLFRAHDHRRFEITAYADLARADAVTGILRRLVDRWRPIAGLPDEAVAARVRRDRIDILVDLSLHTASNRLLVFARRPAPVQVTFAGYPGTTGLGTIDCRLTDPHLDPPGGDDSVYTERSVRLPETFWCFDPMVEAIPVGPLPASTAGRVTFGCLNHYCKVNVPVIETWARVLARVPGARIVVFSPEGAHRGEAIAVFARGGVDPSRVEFVGAAPREEYFRRYHRIDLVLDTWPYNGHTTSLDALFMGVPVVTLVGRTVVGRAGLSQLTNVGLAELAARTADEFVGIAAALAADLPRLAALRKGLRDRMRRSPLMDGERFARHVEAAYRDLWGAVR